MRDHRLACQHDQAPAGALSSCEPTGLFLCLQTVAKRKQKGTMSEETVLSCKTQIKQLALQFPGQTGPCQIAEVQTLAGQFHSLAPRVCTFCSLGLVLPLRKLFTVLHSVTVL